MNIDEKMPEDPLKLFDYVNVTGYNGSSKPDIHYQNLWREVIELTHEEKRNDVLVAYLNVLEHRAEESADLHLMDLLTCVEQSLIKREIIFCPYS